MRTVFQEIAAWRRERFVCPGCGKRRARSKKFYQTLNPWNRDKRGVTKTEEQIHREVGAAAKAWKPVCAACDSSRHTSAVVESEGEARNG